MIVIVIATTMTTGNTEVGAKGGGPKGGGPEGVAAEAQGPNALGHRLEPRVQFNEKTPRDKKERSGRKGHGAERRKKKKRNFVRTG